MSKPVGEKRNETLLKSQEWCKFIVNISSIMIAKRTTHKSCGRMRRSMSSTSRNNRGRGDPARADHVTLKLTRTWRVHHKTCIRTVLLFF